MTYFVADNNGNVIGHDLEKIKATLIAEYMKDLEPNAGWEVLESEV